MSCQIIRVISSPSISTTGLATLIFAISDKAFLQVARTAGEVAGGRAYSISYRAAEAYFAQRFPRADSAAIPPARRVLMPGAGTDKTKRWIEQPAPIVVLVEPQLGENIGAAARAMANFGLSRLRD